MSRYRKVLSRIWIDDKFPHLSLEGRVLFLYHLTSERSTPFLLYVEGAGAIADALRLPQARLRQAMKEVADRGMAWYADDGSNLLFLPNALKIRENAPESPNAVKTWLALMADLPRTPFYHRCIGHWRAIAEGIPYALTRAFLKPCLSATPIQEQEQEQEQEREKEAPPPAEGKRRFGRHVLLTDAEHEDLGRAMGGALRDDYIERLNNYAEQKPGRFAEYRSHYATLKSWRRMDSRGGAGAPSELEAALRELDGQLGELRRFKEHARSPDIIAAKERQIAGLERVREALSAGALPLETYRGFNVLTELHRLLKEIQRHGE